MIRSAFGLALGLLMVPSLAQAQQPGSVTTPTDVTLTRPFKNVFNRAIAPRPQMAQKFPSAPQKADAPPDCRMLILPVDPALDAKIRVGTVDERLDPRFVMRVPACQPANETRPPRD